MLAVIVSSWAVHSGEMWNIFNKQAWRKDFYCHRWFAINKQDNIRAHNRYTKWNRKRHWLVVINKPMSGRRASSMLVLQWRFCPSMSLLVYEVWQSNRFLFLTAKWSPAGSVNYTRKLKQTLLTSVAYSLNSQVEESRRLILRRKNMLEIMDIKSWLIDRRAIAADTCTHTFTRAWVWRLPPEDRWMG